YHGLTGALAPGGRSCRAHWHDEEAAAIHETQGRLAQFDDVRLELRALVHEAPRMLQVDGRLVDGVGHDEDLGSRIDKAPPEAVEDADGRLTDLPRAEEERVAIRRDGPKPFLLIRQEGVRGERLDEGHG